jgi:hypothetical protein
MQVRKAACHCGEAEMACAGDPSKVSMCHCLDCQRRTGSIFSIAVFFDRKRVTIERGNLKCFERPSASGHSVAFHFCDRCGSNLFWEPRRLPELIGVAVGVFADPHFPVPEQSVWTRDKHDWLELPTVIRQFDLGPARVSPGGASSLT